MARHVNPAVPGIRRAVSSLRMAVEHLRARPLRLVTAPLLFAPGAPRVSSRRGPAAVPGDRVFDRFRDAELASERAGRAPTR